jgi:riboflavin synthase
MFTGIIEELGTVTHVEKQLDARRITIQGAVVTSDIKRGDSIAVSGVCLTAVELDGDKFTADVMEETLRLTTLGHVKAGSRVNLERAMNASTRFGGHMVLGHVDGVGEIVSREQSEHWEWVRVRVPVELLKYVVLKGSITLDGVSLTVNEIGKDFIGLSLIPETMRLTTLGSKQVEDEVNLEVDIMAKHIERLLEGRN